MAKKGGSLATPDRASIYIIPTYVLSLNVAKRGLAAQKATSF